MKPSLYIHIPFCRKKCPYCAFPVIVGQTQRMMEYVQVVLNEARLYHGREISTVYVGGGTPSMLDEVALGALLKGMGECFRIDDDERTFEFNPESVDPQRAAQVRRAGFNRASLGLQTFSGEYLLYLGRGHDAQQGRAAFGMLRQAGFGNISVDLMFGFPGQSFGDLDADLDEVLALGSEHVAAYALTVEQQSLFAVRAQKISDDMQGRMYGHVRARLREAGFRQYEISNFARPGFASRHNINYWHGGEYVALGVGAHGHLDGQRYWNAETLARYLGMMREGGHAVVGREKLAPEAKMMECLLFWLRMNEGVDVDSLERRFHARFSAKTVEALESLVANGWLRREGGRVQATDAGQLVLDEIAVRLV